MHATAAALESARTPHPFSRVLTAPDAPPVLHTVCAWCGHARDVRGRWHADPVAFAIGGRTLASHGICPECRARVEGEDEAR